MNWWRITANAGLTFFTSLIGFTAIGSQDAIIGSILTAFITAGVAGFTEMKNECQEDKPITTAMRIKKVISKSLVF
jgi:hypothetical protein